MWLRVRCSIILSVNGRLFGVAHFSSKDLWTITDTYCNHLSGVQIFSPKGGSWGRAACFFILCLSTRKLSCLIFSASCSNHWLVIVSSFRNLEWMDVLSHDNTVVLLQLFLLYLLHGNAISFCYFRSSLCIHLYFN